MNYYSHHIGDFRSGSVHMSRVKRWIYRDMLDVYYDTERPLSLDLDEVCNCVGVESAEERQCVADLLKFKFRKCEDGYRHDRCDTEIDAYHAKAETARENGKGGGRPPKATNQKPKSEPKITQSVSDGLPIACGLKTNQEPITNIKKESSSSVHPRTDDDDDYSTKPKLPEPEPPDLPNNPALAMTVALRKLGVTVTSMHPTLLDWVAKGVTIPVAIEAVSMARQYKPLPESIPPAYLSTIIGQLLNPQPAGKAAAPLEIKPWWQSASGIDAKGAELGLRMADGEIFPNWKLRVLSAAGDGPWQEQTRIRSVEGFRNVAQLVAR